MKFLRYGPRGQEKPAVLDAEGQVRCLSAHVTDIDGSFLAQRDVIMAGIDLASLPHVAEPGRIAEPVARVGKFVCIGLNYRDHAIEAGMPIPSEPIVFMKATSAIIGPDDDVLLPPTSMKSDWEVELGVVIGKDCRYVSEADAMDHVAGLCVVNDLSEREYQLERGGQWDKGKGCDTFGPFGPWLVTLDEVADIDNLDMWLDVNGVRMQTGNTSTLIFNVPHIVHYLSQFMSLQAGDIISTGTPFGVGMGRKPPVYLAEGDVMTLGIAGLGAQRQQVRRWPG
ncbi:fumarylacetoacetate (FAA) hydrolase [Polymorphobacter multimanifer]|uniref:2-keto-4-pentenoate hydratase/2-oxohepta-3-ene-1,7-dioic acid hydratase in catechol pathway n=1 Tax=Polymorphobacter multimanifer TaxID=1070431 RepID=A0A841L2F5_9SPHN|nr:fumarylacetoacetate hydrolase family protein [Polymorphobacter multimanifer]MBB6226496.1 2-keto-4-pentenoate hydratase/2-oxohepta-3-ene-1,7-dioic acid hydratase in catechol pathway [Polymorphobacter multimanifer]GGI75879.1 fumarylacetoacetate (FAA) hydrolase [Polymorphobacter multimanifer]